MPGNAIERRPGRLPVAVPGVPVRRRQSEALPARALRSARRNRHVTVPAAVPAAAWTAAEIMHAFGMAGYWGIAGLVLTGSVWYFSRRKWDRDPEVWYARLSVLALWLWLWYAAALGVSLPALAALLTLAGVWGVPWYRHKRPRDRRRRQRDLARWQAWWDHHAAHWSLGGSTVTEAEDKRAQVRLRVQLWAGRHTTATVRAAVPQVESALDGVSDIGMVRVQPVPGHPSQVDLFLKRDNPLREVIEWDQSLAPASVHGDAVLGMDETGEWGTAPMRVSAFVTGKTRSGKGNHLLLRAAQLSGCPDGRQVVIDLKQRAARELLRSAALEYVITSRDEARAYLAMLCAEIRARAREADTGEEQLHATEMTPAIHTLVDEANPLTSVTAGDSECARLLGIGASQGSGLEVYYEVYTQYGALDESVRTEQVRGNLPLRVCYATESGEHGQYALGDGYRFATGADTSKLEEKGEFLMKLGPKAKPERLRAPHMPFSLFRQIASANAERLRRKPLMLYCGSEQSPVPGQTWQQWWDRRFLRIDPAFRRDSPQYAAAAEEFGTPQPAAAHAPASRPAAAPAPEAGPAGAEVAAAIAAETAGPDLEPAPAAAARAAGGAAARKQAFCDALAAASGGTSPAELIQASGMPRSTVMDHLRRLTERGAVTQPEKGVYLPVPGRSVHAELGAVAAGDDALLGDGGPGRLHLVQSAS
jgi:hypothetical protein